MRAVVQRVVSATLTIDDAVHASIDRGLVVLVGIDRRDTERDRRYLADKIVHLRIFPDDQGKMNLSVLDIGGAVLLVPNFTVMGETHKGRRPSFDAAMRPPQASTEFDALAGALVERGVEVRTGVFGAHMLVALVNDGPVTLIVQS